MDILSGQQNDRLVAAQAVLRGWMPNRMAPELVPASLSVLHGGAPSLIYTISEKGAGPELRGAVVSLTVEKIAETAFVRDNLLFSSKFTIVTEEESLWGAENRAIFGEDLRQDDHRWRLFRATLLAPLDLGDNLRIIFTEPDGQLLGLCGSFTTGTRRFTEGDRMLLDAFSGSLRAVVYAWEALAPAFGARHPIMQMALAWPSPAFATTLDAEFLFANHAARIALPDRPGWLAEALREPAAVPAGWSISLIPFKHGTIAVFIRRQTRLEDWFIQAAVERLGLSNYLVDVAVMAIKGCTYEEMCGVTGKSMATINTYMARVRKQTGTAHRGEMIYEAISRIFAECDLWPVIRRALVRRRASD